MSVGNAADDGPRTLFPSVERFVRGDHMAEDADRYRFDSVLDEVPSNYPHIQNVALEVPAHVSQGFGIRGHVPVVGTVDGTRFTATLVPVGDGRHRLYLNGQTRGAIGKGHGDKVTIEIRFDPSDRMPDVPDDLASALDDADARLAWDALPASRRKEFLVVLADSKRASTRSRRIGRIVAEMLEEGTRRLR